MLNCIIPSRIGSFNQGYYPAFLANEASNTAEAWCAGTDVEPKTMQLTAQKAAAKAKKSGLSRLKTGVKAAAPDAEESKGGDSSAQVAQLQARVAQLERDLAAASTGGASTGGDVAGASENYDSRPEFGYWSIRGLGAPCRMMFYYCNVDFEDKLYECGDAPDFDKSCWTDVKETMGMEYPNLPYLIDGETKISETAAIMQYIAKKWKPELLGRDAAELGRVNMLWAHVMDLKMKSTIPCYTGDGNADAILDAVRPILAKLVESMGESSFIAGENPTWLDFYFAENLDMLDKLGDGLFFAEFPGLQTYWERFIALPSLAEAWADDSKLMKQPFNNKMARNLNE